MITGLIIIAIATMFVAKAPTMTFWILAATLFMTRIGASIVEVSTESYFFRRVHHDDTGSIGFFRNTYPFAYIIAPLLSSVVLKFAPLWTLYIALGVICLLGVIVAKDITKTQ
jgi:fucose permease